MLRPGSVVRTFELLTLCVACAGVACGGASDEGSEIAESGPTQDADSGTEAVTGDGDGDPSGDGDGEPDPGADREALIQELEQPGPYAVGFKQLEINYTPPGGGEPRIVPVLAWYPSVEGAEGELAKYSLAGLVQLPNTSSLADVEVADDGPFPVVVYSHGSGGDAVLAYPFAERFASHGWILLSPEHVGNTVSDLLNGNNDSFMELLVNRPADIRALLDESEAGFGGEPVAAAADLSKVFLFGHSFGGYTTFASSGVELDYQGLLGSCGPEECEFLMQPEVEAAINEGGLIDPRIDAISPQAPAFYSGFAEGAYADLGIPTLLQSGKLDITTTDASEAQPAWDALANEDDIWLDMPFGGHYSFITICTDLLPELLVLVQPDNMNDGCGPDFTPTEELIPVLTTYMLAFAKQHVLGETEFGVIFEGASLHPEVDLHRH